MANKNFTVKNGLEVGGQEVISSSGAITSAALGGQVLGTSASPSFANITTAGYLRGPASFVIDPAAHGDDTGTVVIAGNLQVDGTQTTINSTTMTVDDLNLTLASGAANAAAANGAGITVDIAGATNPSLVYGSSNDDWTFNKNLNVTGNGALSGNLDVVGQIGAYDNPGSAWGKMILRATDFEFKNAGGTIIGSFDTSNHLRIVNDLQMDSTNPKLDYDNGDSNGSFRLFSTSSNAATHQFFPNGHAHFITTAGTFKIEGLGSTSNQIESGGSLKVRSVSGHVDLLDGTTEVLQTTTTGVTLPLNLVVNGKLGINENSLSSNARLQVRYDNSQSYSAYNALTNPSMIIKNITAGASKFTSLGFITESNGEGAISLVQGSGNINADMTFSVRSSGTRAEHMRITHDGKVLIGDTASVTSDLLQIETPASGGGHGIQIRRNDSNTDQGIGHILFGNNTATDLAKIAAGTDGNVDSGYLIFATQPTSGNLTDRMMIDSDGKVGIGTTAPTTLTEIRGTVPTLTLSSSESKTWSNGDDIAKISFFSRDGSGIGAHETGFILNKTENSGASLSGVLVFGVANYNTAAAEAMRIDHDGNVGIGTDDPSFTAVSGSTNQIGLEIQNGNNDSSAHLKLTGRNNTGTPGQPTSFEIIHRGDALKTSFIHGGTERMTINSAGTIKHMSGAGTLEFQALGGSSNQIEGSGSLKIKAAGGSVDLLNGTTEVLNTTTTGVTLPLNLVVNGDVTQNSVTVKQEYFTLPASSTSGRRIRITLGNYESCYVRIGAQRSNGGDAICYWEGLINNNNNANYATVFQSKSGNPAITFDYTTTTIFQWTFNASLSSGWGTFYVQEIGGTATIQQLMT